MSAGSHGALGAAGATDGGSRTTDGASVSVADATVTEPRVHDPRGYGPRGQTSGGRAAPTLLNRLG